MSSMTQAAVVAAAIGLTLAACSRERSSSGEIEADEYFVERVKLPGFSMDAPKGEVIFSSQSPTNGTHEIKPPRASTLGHFVDDEVIYNDFSVHWSTDAENREKWQANSLAFYLRALSGVIPNARVLRDGALAPDRWYAVIGDDRAPVSVGVVVCDPHFKVEFLFSRYHDVARQEKLVLRALESVRCEVTDENRAQLLAATHLPDDFGWIANEAGQQFQSLGGESLLVSITTGEIPRERDVYRATILAIFTAMDAETPDSALVDLRRRSQVPSRQVTLSKARLPNSGGTAYVGTMFCAAQGNSLVMIWTAPLVTDELAWTRLSQIDCPGAPSKEVPEFSELAASACEAGDARGCELASPSRGS